MGGMVLVNCFARVLFLFVCSALFLCSVSVVFAHGDEEHDTLSSEVNVCHALSEGEKESCYSSLCEGDMKMCGEDIVDAAMAGSGPKLAFAVLNDLAKISEFQHETYILAQRVGRILARENNGTGEAFLRCQSDFRYGCPYGFFEAAAGEQDMKQAAEKICGSLSSASRNKCYHRMGHIFMKQRGHVAEDGALLDCDALSDTTVQQHCYDGVFMEGVHEMKDGGNVSGFADLNVLAPCNTLVEKYRKSCYSHHGDYMIQYFGGSTDKAYHACDAAGPHADVCKKGLKGTHSHDFDTESSESDSLLSKIGQWFGGMIAFITNLFSDSDETDGSHSEHDGAGHDSDGAGMTDHANGEMSNGMGKMAALGATIVYRDGAYAPETVKIAVGQRVVFVNEDQVFWPASDKHPTHREYPGSNILRCHTDAKGTLFDACEAMGPGAEYSFTFDKVGEWKFHDHVNPKARGCGGCLSDRWLMFRGCWYRLPAVMLAK